MSRVAALILAAGRGTRFGSGAHTSKALALLRGKPLVVYVVEAALASRACDLVVVSGQAAEGVTAALGLSPARLVHNPGFEAGMASSLQVGLSVLSPDVAGVVVLLADMPLITGAMIDQLIARFEAGGAVADAVIPVRQGRQGNPVLLGRTIFPAIATLTGDQGARKILSGEGRAVLTCAIDDEAIELDVDTPQTLALLAERLSYKS